MPDTQNYIRTSPGQTKLAGRNFIEIWISRLRWLDWLISTSLCLCLGLKTVTISDEIIIHIREMCRIV